MKRATLSAKKFTISSYPEDVFSVGFHEKPKESPEEEIEYRKVPTSAKKDRIRSQISSRAGSNQDKNTYDSKTANSEDFIVSKSNHRRQRVPHDVSKVNTHGDYCKSFKSSMVTSVCGYHPRQKGLFGKSNRIQHLRSLFDKSDPNSVCPEYPAAYHGTGGECRPLALGLTEAGCPSSEARTLQIASTFGEARVLKRITAYKDTPSPMLDDTILSPPRIRKANPSPKNFYEVLNILPSKVGSIIEKSIAFVNQKSIPTRYSANTEWSRRTYHLVQPDSKSASYIAENDRLTRCQFVDEQKRIDTARHQFRVQNMPQRNALSA